MKAKEAAEKRAKELEELDNEFGVEALVSSSLKEDRQTEYDRKNLKGLKVGKATTILHGVNFPLVRLGTVQRYLGTSQPY